MIKTIYLLRHGQSMDNIAPVRQSPDSPLSPEGEKQALQIAQRVVHLPFDVLLASPYPRAQQTATAISKATGKPIESIDLFIERIKPTSINGKLFSDIPAAAINAQWEESLCTPGMKVEDGENYDEILTRTDAALSLLADRPEQSIVVVSHGHFIRSMIARILLGATLTPQNFHHIHKTMHMENTGLTVLHHNPSAQNVPSWKLWIWNDHTHLGE